MRTPDDLTPGERVQFTGFRDYVKDKYKFNRSATFIRRLPCGYEFKFDAGYVEHWNYANLIYVLNNVPMFDAVPICHKTLEAHVKALSHG